MSFVLRRTLFSLALLLLLFLVVAPFYWIFSSSVKLPPEIIASTPTLFPQSFTMQHYANLLGGSPFLSFMGNSLIVGLGTMIITVILSTLAAYGLYRLRFPGRRLLFHVILITYAFPGVLLLIPLYGLLSDVGIIDTLWALIVVDVTLAAPFATWMLQAFFRTIPMELEEAAALDGATRLGIITRILLPLAAPGVASIAIFAFITSWTEYMFASVLIISEANRTLPVGLAGIIGQYQIDWGLLMAGATMTTLPVLLLFALVGRNFVEGLTAGAVK
jgi:ABC-type glycerol-3-phosphate transport system permease component